MKGGTRSVVPFALVVCAFDFLGPLCGRIDGIDVTPRAPKERSLLAMLVVQPGRVVSADHLIDQLWANLPVERARKVLWVRVSNLRKLLSTARAASLLEQVAPGYRLAITANDVDAHRFFAFVADARRHRARGDIVAAAGTLRQALALWRGEALADAQGCFALEAEAARLTEARLDATEDWVDAELTCGRYDSVHAELGRLIIAYPLRERLARQQAMCLYCEGRQVEALAVCRALRARLLEELGLEPGPELRKLEQEIVERRLSLAVPTPLIDAAPGAASERVSRPDVEVSRHAIQSRPMYHPSPPSGAASPDRSGAFHHRTPPTVGPPPLGLRAAASRRRRHNLPLELTSFVGRVHELDKVADLLASFRLVTLTGPGGVGKTRLALAAAAAALDRYRDGVWLIELASVRADAAVVTAFSRALGVTASGHRGHDDLALNLVRYLAGRQCLLVIDTAEHVLDGVAELVLQLMANCGELTLLVTSRERLRVPGEATFAVPPLSLPHANDEEARRSDAVALFYERARAARPQMTLGAADLAAAVKICSRVDGLPLAIELAAARVHLLGARQIAERLDDCFAMLGSERAKGVPERHQTLRATLDWSHDLLTPAERRALRRLAVFPGDFDLDAAIAVLDVVGMEHVADDVDGFTIVSRLVDKSLVVVGGGRDDVRYRLLDPVRQYAAERLAEAGETAALRARHRDVFLARQPTLWPLMTAQERERACADRENLIAALEWSWCEGDDAAALRLVTIQSTTWMAAGDAEGREWLERVLAQPGPSSDPWRARALHELARSLSDAGVPDIERIDRLLAESRAIAEQVGDAPELAACYLAHVDTLLPRGRVDEARSLTQAALDIYTRNEAAAGLGWCHQFLGWIGVAEGDAELARSGVRTCSGYRRFHAGMRMAAGPRARRARSGRGTTRRVDTCAPAGRRGGVVRTAVRPPSGPRDGVGTRRRDCHPRQRRFRRGGHRQRAAPVVARSRDPTMGGRCARDGNRRPRTPWSALRVRPRPRRVPVLTRGCWAARRWRPRRLRGSTAERRPAASRAWVSRIRRANGSRPVADPGEGDGRHGRRPARPSPRRAVRPGKPAVSPGGDADRCLINRRRGDARAAPSRQREHHEEAHRRNHRRGRRRVRCSGGCARRAAAEASAITA